MDLVVYDDDEKRYVPWAVVLAALLLVAVVTAGLTFLLARQASGSDGEQAVSGVSSAGLRIAVLPAASAGASPHDAIGIGKFHGTITPTTPIGSWNVTSTPPATGICLPNSRSGAPA